MSQISLILDKKWPEKNLMNRDMAGAPHVAYV